MVLHIREVKKTIDLIDPDCAIVLWGLPGLYEKYAESFKTIYPGTLIRPEHERDQTLEQMEERFRLNSVQLSTLPREKVYFFLFVGSQGADRVIAQMLFQHGYANVLRGEHMNQIIDCVKVYGDYLRFVRLNADPDFPVVEEYAYAYTAEWNATAGRPVTDSYFVQDLWGARKVFERRPEMHYDVGSRVDGFISHLLSFNMRTVLVDIRPLDLCGTENLSFIQADATELTGIADGSIVSLSALCSLEHFGLGRYGDPVDPTSHLKAFQSFQRVMKPGGDLYISLPIGPRCMVAFNGHRIYTPEYVLSKFNRMRLAEFSAAMEDGLWTNAPTDARTYEHNTERGTSGMGLFHFIKN